MDKSLQASLAINLLPDTIRGEAQTLSLPLSRFQLLTLRPLSGLKLPTLATLDSTFIHLSVLRKLTKDSITVSFVFYPPQVLPKGKERYT